MKRGRFTAIGTIGVLRQSMRRASGPRISRMHGVSEDAGQLRPGMNPNSDIHCYLQAGFLKAVLERGEFASELHEFAVAEFRKDKLV